MDGTLLDTERLARACFLRACRDVGWEVDVRIYDRCVGTTCLATKRIMLEGFGADFPHEAMSEHWSEHYHAHVNISQ
jgi:beta-phosphoglucomutase-like phosphatase (HAD superfamily)